MSTVKHIDRPRVEGERVTTWCGAEPGFAVRFTSLDDAALSGLNQDLYTACRRCVAKATKALKWETERA